jgi:hypothetical protein
VPKKARRRSKKAGAYTLRDLVRTFALLAIFVVSSLPIFLELYDLPQAIKLEIILVLFGSGVGALGSTFRRTQAGLIVGLLLGLLFLGLSPGVR